MNDLKALLDSRNIIYSNAGENKVLISCLNPDHEDKNPSMLVNLDSGWGHCLSCGHNENLFTKCGKRPRVLEIRRSKLLSTISDKVMESIGLDFPSDIAFWDNDYRGISAKTYREFEAFQWAAHTSRIFFPIKRFSGKTYNFIGRDTLGDRKPKYLLSNNTPLELYPIPEIDHFGSVILVEGIFDALNLFDKGIRNCTAVFGVANFDQDMTKLDILKLFDIVEIVTMFDSDAAGQNGAEKIKKYCDNNFLSYRNVKLPNGKDPGDLTYKEVQNIRGKLYESSSN